MHRRVHPPDECIAECIAKYTVESVELSATKGYSAPKAPVKDSVNFKDSAQAP